MSIFLPIALAKRKSTTHQTEIDPLPKPPQPSVGQLMTVFWGESSIPTPHSGQVSAQVEFTIWIAPSHRASSRLHQCQLGPATVKS
eukprot:4527142-Amphidinium_carterae.1